MDEQANSAKKSHVLIMEDDLDQMSLLVDFVQTEIKNTINNEHIDADKKQMLLDIKIITVTNIASLRKAVALHGNVLLAILDCNIPDTRGGVPHDQFIKTNHLITGQHVAVDIVSNALPRTPITMISSLNRFQKIINVYYKNKYGFAINFIRKSDASTIQNNIGWYLRQFMK